MRYVSTDNTQIPADFIRIDKICYSNSSIKLVAYFKNGKLRNRIIIMLILGFIAQCEQYTCTGLVFDTDEQNIMCKIQCCES